MSYSTVHAPLLALLSALLLTLSTACGLMTETPQPETACFPACSVDETCSLSEDGMTARCIDTFTGGGPLEGIESCQWLAECVDECERQQLDSKCTAECEQQAEADVQKVQSTWRACVHTNCSGIRSSECLRQWCAPQTTRCFGDLPGEALTIGSMICLDVAECTQNCLDDPDCTEGCLHNGTVNAQTEWTTLTACAEQKCPDPTTDYDAYLKCAESECSDDFKTCFGPGPSPPEGTESCDEIFRCSLACADAICVQNCQANGTLKARQNYKVLVECTHNRCNPRNNKEVDPAMCSALRCEPAMNHCFGEHAIK